MPKGASPHVSIGRSWEHLWVDEMAHVLPLAIVSPYALSIPNCVGSLILDAVTRRKLNFNALGLREALSSLRLEDDFELESSILDCETPSAAYQIAQEVIQESTGTRPPKWTGSVSKRLGQLWHRLLLDDPLSPGLTVHQAKGNEWDTVEFVADVSDVSALKSGFSKLRPEDRIRYVGLTRAKFGLRITEIPYIDLPNRQGLKRL